MMCTSMVCKVCVCAVRADAGGVRRAQRELDARRGTRARRQRSPAKVHAQRIFHAGRRRNRTLSPLPYSGFYFFSFLFLLFFMVFFSGGWDLILLLKFSFNLSLNFTTVSNDSEKVDRSIEKVIGDFLVISLVFFIIQLILCSTFGLYCQLQLNRFCIFF